MKCTGDMSNNKQQINRYRLFTRSQKNLPPLGLTTRDISILRFTDDYRFLNTSQIQALVGGSPHNVSVRLLRLFQHGYLDRPAHQRELRAEGSRVLVHALGAKGARLLAQRSGDTSSLTRHLAEHNRSAKHIYLAHRLMISQFRACLTLACNQDAGITLVAWEIPERTIARIRVSGYHVAVVPDAYFVLADNDGKKAHFYLEADRGTMTHKRFLPKLKAYWQARSIDSSSLFPGSFRVLTITRSAQRATNLIMTAKLADSKHKGSRMFYFACEDAYSLEHPETMFNYIWRSPADTKPHSLLEGKQARKQD